MLMVGASRLRGRLADTIPGQTYRDACCWVHSSACLSNTAVVMRLAVPDHQTARRVCKRGQLRRLCHVRNWDRTTPRRQGGIGRWHGDVVTYR